MNFKQQSTRVPFKIMESNKKVLKNEDLEELEVEEDLEGEEETDDDSEDLESEEETDDDSEDLESEEETDDDSEDLESEEETDDDSEDLESEEEPGDFYEDLESEEEPDDLEEVESEEKESYKELKETLTELSLTFKEVISLISDLKKDVHKNEVKLEALLALKRVEVGIEKSTPKPENKVGTLVKISGKCVPEDKQVFLLKETSDGFRFSMNSQKTLRGSVNAYDGKVKIVGTLPPGEWVVCKGKTNVYLLSLDMFETYDRKEKQVKSSGEVIIKKGKAKSVKGFKLVEREDSFVLTEKEAVCTGKYTSNCNYPVKGNIPDGKWVVVEDNINNRYWLVNAEDVQPTQKTVTKKNTKKAAKKAVKPVKKAVKPVKKAVKKNKKNKK